MTPRPLRSALVPSNDPYLLRLLLWCGPCDLRMVCTSTVVHGNPRRTYKCSMACRRIHLFADELESLTWTAAERRATISDIAEPFRKSALELLLVKAVIGPNPDDLAFTWKT